MVHFTKEQLLKRDKIIQSQKQFIKYLDRYKINKLNNIFNGNNPTIIKYIQDEREQRGLKNDNITVRSAVYGENKQKSSLEIMILKNDIKK